MERFQTVINLLKAFVNSKSEWFYSYRVIAVLLFVLVEFVLVYSIFGYSTLTSILLFVLKLFIIIHVAFSLMGVIKDYVYDYRMLSLYKFLVLLLVMKVGIYYLF